MGVKAHYPVAVFNAMIAVEVRATNRFSPFLVFPVSGKPAILGRGQLGLVHRALDASGPRRGHTNGGTAKRDSGEALAHLWVPTHPAVSGSLRAGKIKIFVVSRVIANARFLVHSLFLDRKGLT